MQTTLETAQSLAAQIPGSVVEQVSRAGWVGPFAAPQEYTIILPSGARIDAGGLSYSLRASPDASVGDLVLIMARTSLYEQGASLAASSALAQRDVYGGVSPVVVPRGTTVYGGVPVLSEETYAGTLARMEATRQAATRAGAGVTQTTEGGRSMTIAERIRAMAAESGIVGAATPDVWGWFYRQVTGSDAPAPEMLGYTRGADLSLPDVSWEEWWGKVQTALGTQVAGSGGAGAGGGGGIVSPGNGDRLTAGPGVLPKAFTDFLRQNQTLIVVVLVILVLWWLLS